MLTFPELLWEVLQGESIKDHQLFLVNNIL